MKNEITSSHSYTLEGGMEAVEELGEYLSAISGVPERMQGYVVLRALKEKMRIDIFLHKFKAEAEERRKRPKPPTVRKVRDL